MFADFEVFDPAEASFTGMSEGHSVEGASLTAGFSQSPDKDAPLLVNEAFTVVADIRDLGSDLVLANIDWKVGGRHCLI